MWFDSHLAVNITWDRVFAMTPALVILFFNICTPMFIAVLAKVQKQPQIPINSWMDKKDVVHIYSAKYSAMRKKNILPFAATGMDLEHIMLNVMSQTERQVLLWYNLWMESKKVIPIKKKKTKHLMESKMVVSRVWVLGIRVMSI